MVVRLLTRSDIPAGMRLKNLAGWNQTPADWGRLLCLSPVGCFAAEEGLKVVGTVTAVAYEGRLAWIGMLLVDPEYRRRGLGTLLLKKAIEYLEGIQVPTIKLDTNLKARAVYETLGFVSEYEIERWVLHREPIAVPVLSSTGVPDITRIIEADREIFGANRGDLLALLHADAPDFTLAVELEGEVLGYCLGRGGSRADHLGPWMAWDEPTAWELLDEFLRRSGRETVYVDCLKNNPMARELLRSRGFVIARSLTRMYRGPNTYPGRPELLCAVLGPEFG